MKNLCLNLTAAAAVLASITSVAALAEELPPYNPVIDPANFVGEITNPYFPLKPGMVFKFEGTRDGVARRDDMTVTNETKVIMGVTTMVVRDVASTDTEMVEKTVDWYAQDKDGNVWYFGEDTAEYANGKVTNTDGTWMAGVDGAIPGIIMKAAPKVGDGYRQEYRPGVAEDYAKVVNIDATAGGPSGKYEMVVVTEDTDLLDKSKFEHKWFAPKVGPIGTDGMVGGHHEIRTLKTILMAQ
jgi:hypothetical protein